MAGLTGAFVAGTGFAVDFAIGLAAGVGFVAGFAAGLAGALVAGAGFAAGADFAGGFGI